MSASDVIARLRELRAKATAGPWEADNFNCVDGYGQYQAFHILDAKGKALLDTSNSDIQVIHDDRGEGPDGPEGSRWDETGRRDTAAIVAAMNSLPALLECAEALASIANCQNPDKCKSCSNIARAALQALAEGGGE